ncbi:uncharacterized protein F4812DRAFT_393216 [Daldinia caldariorum]|uniref:uncharacterized protein n=1 Tax=Daldinia caldariorum TaxID=326644 RepID=UPI0020088D36|nr:uncharacterized protein F4812DRAFT_393216 [Daldinia caldariorum]KAI1467343.1 hypothetical protein F4812DRAFT_393216 [Daldinia caldariorum]
MLAKQQTVALLYAALLGSSVVQAATEFPTCITSCVRQNGCPPTDVDCMCKKASGNFLSDVVVCMNQWCSSGTTLADLIDPIQSNCDIPKSAIQAAESKAGFDTGSKSNSDSDDEKSTSTSETSTAKPSVIMSVGSPNKIDGPSSSTSGTAPTGSATKGSVSTMVLSDTTAVVGPAPTASESLLVAATTLPSSAAASTPTSSSSSSSSNDEESSPQGSDGTPGSVPSGDSTEEGSASSSQASLLAAILAVGATMAFGW